MKEKVFPGILILCIVFSVSFFRPEIIEASNPDKVIAKVGDVTITQKQFESFSQSALAHKNEMTRQQILNEMINMAILYQEAKRLNLDKRKDVKEILQDQEKNLLVQTLLKEKINKKVTVTEAKAKELYDKNWMDSKYPRWVGVTIFRIHYNKKEQEKAAFEYAQKTRKKVKTKDFEKDAKTAFEKLKKELPPPEGITIDMSEFPKFFLLKFRKYKTDLEELALNLKKGENSPIMTIKRGDIFLFINLTIEYPKEEIPFKKVKSDLMMSAGELIHQQNVNKYIDKMEDRYKIEIYK